MNSYTSTSKKRLKAKKAVLYIFVFCFLFINAIGALNYLVDPMWAFEHKNYLNVKKIDFDERQQKTNYLYFVNNDYNNIILGSSRTTYLNKNILEKNFGKSFNYAANAMDLHEYQFFLENFTELTNKKPKNIILGVDFFAVSKNKAYQISKSAQLQNAKSFFYRLKLLYSIDTLRYSFTNIKETARDKKGYYDQNFTKIIDVKKTKASSLKDFIPFKYDENMTEYYKKLKNKYKTSNFIIFTPPVTVEQLLKNNKNGLDKYYFRWLRELVGLFGNVYHFMYPSSFSRNYDNFYDANHFHHISGKIIANDIVKGIKTARMEHGIILNKENIDKFIINYKKLLKPKE